MGYYSGFKYGTGVYYGPVCAISAVSPVEGPAPGGNSFVITGTGFDPRQWDDMFTAAALVLARWSDISFGGSVSTGPYHLGFSTSVVPASTAGILSVMQWYDVQGEVRVIISPVVSRPLSEIDVLVFTLSVDSSNYAEMYVRMDTAGNMMLHCETWVGGIMRDELKSPLVWTTGLATFKILRYGTDVYFVANGSVICRIPGFIATPASFMISTRNLSAAYDVDCTRVELFYYRPFAVFQNQPVHDTVIVSDNRARGLVPASRDITWQFAAYEGPVDVSIIGEGPTTSTDAYKYYYVAGMKSINSTQFSVEMSLINDAQLATPDGENKGFGGGY